MAESSKKPSIEEVLQYVERQLDLQISKIAGSLPDEQKDEIRQDAKVRAWQAYDKLEADRGWKSFMQLHVRGSILDYIRWGRGFQESTLTKRDEKGDEVQEIKPWRLKQRITYIGTESSEGEARTFEDVLGSLGIFTPEINHDDEGPIWDLIARMASQDQDIHLVAKLMIGFTHEQVAEIWGVSRERITQRLAEFCQRLDDPQHLGSRWIAQTIFAFGLCHVFNQPQEDLGFGWEYSPVDLYATNLDYLDSINPQLTFEFVFN